MGHTDLDYYIEAKLVNKLDLMIKRCEQDKPEMDVLLINEGGEGEGKTNNSIAEAYYVHYHTRREIHLFFRLEALIDFAKTTTRKIIIWDEPSLDSLSTDSLNKLNKDLIRLLMTVRMNRHFFIFNLTKFFKFSEYIVVDRAVCMLHTFLLKQEKIGHFVYIKRRNLERLYNDYKFSKMRNYRRLASLHGYFPDVMRHLDHMDLTINGVPHATQATYRAEKSKAIEGIGEDRKEDEKIKAKAELKAFKRIVGKLIVPILTRKDLASGMGIDEKTLITWARLPLEASGEANPLEKQGFEAGGGEQY